MEWTYEVLYVTLSWFAGIFPSNKTIDRPQGRLRVCTETKEWVHHWMVSSNTLLNSMRPLRLMLPLCLGRLDGCLNLLNIYIYIIIYIIYNIIYICINGDNWGIHSNQLDAYFVGISKIGHACVIICFAWHVNRSWTACPYPFMEGYSWVEGITVPICSCLSLHFLLLDYPICVGKTQCASLYLDIYIYIYVYIISYDIMYYKILCIN